MSASPSNTRLTEALAAMGSLAVWLGLYVAAAAAAIAQLSLFQPLSATALTTCFFAGVAIYLFDRLKLSDRHIDEADRQSQPGRFAFLQRSPGALRILAAVLAVAAATTGAIIHPSVAAGVLIGVAGVWVYSGRRIGNAARPKDILGLKNALAALWIGSFAALIVAADSGKLDLDTITTIAPAMAYLWVIVFIDAMLCDLDDVETDLRFGTKTVPAQAGARTTWISAVLIEAAAGTILFLALDQTDPAAMLWIIALPATTLLLWTAKLSRIRDLIDLRLPILAAIAAMLV